MTVNIEKQIANLTRILEISEKLNHIHDLDALLDKILYEARRFTNADAGSVFLTSGSRLKFSYVQNDTLFQANQNNKFIYSNSQMEINQKSIAGYVAATGESLNIEDAYSIPEDKPYSFNTSFDKSSSYLTKSILCVPLRTSRGHIVGVLQIINALDESKNAIVFSDTDMVTVQHFATSAAVAIERAQMNREMILRMIKMSELRDPKETGAHVQRVGAYSAEIYQKWALNRGIPIKKIKKHKDMVRIAAMIHDVGKVAITDAILKKPGRLTEEEFNVMQYHAIYGGQLFAGSESELDKMSADIALNHHEKWNGKGYPGKVDDITADHVKMGEGKQGKEIPLEARICALADVFDALISKRVYKEPWTEEKVLSIIKEESGQHFDPEIVDAFISIFDVIKAIRNKYQEEAD